MLRRKRKKRRRTMRRRTKMRTIKTKIIKTRMRTRMRRKRMGAMNKMRKGRRTREAARRRKVSKKVSNRKKNYPNFAPLSLKSSNLPVCSQKFQASPAASTTSSTPCPPTEAQTHTTAPPTSPHRAPQSLLYCCLVRNREW